MRKVGNSGDLIYLFRVIVTLLVSLIVAGCATNRMGKVPLGFSVSAPWGTPKIPVNAGILITEETENYQYTILDKYELAIPVHMVVPIGQLLAKGSVDAFSNVFSKAVLIKGSPSQMDAVDIVITPHIEGVEFQNNIIRPDMFTSGTGQVLASLSIKYVVSDKKGMTIFEKTIGVRDIAGREISTTSDGWAQGGEDAAIKAVIAVLQESIKTISSSQEILAYFGTKGIPNTTASKSSPDREMLIRSDVDELPVTQVKPNKNAYAIVIGIENYRQRLPKADFATQDAKLVADYLSKTLGYPEENVITLLNENATNVDLVKYFEKWLPNNVEKGGTVFVYYSGHGAPDPKSGTAFLVPFDGDPSFIDETGYSLKRMYAALGKLQAKEVIVALDSCFSGAGGRSVLAKGARPLVMNLQDNLALPKNMTVMSASSGDQMSSTYDEKGHGLFTYFMLKGIKNEAVTRPDGSIRFDDLFSYLKPQVERIARKQYNNDQTPQLMGTGK